MLHLPSATFTPPPSAWVQVDSVGAGDAENGNPNILSWTHVIGAKATVLVVGVGFALSTATIPTITVTVGSTPITSTVAVENYFLSNYNASIAYYMLLNPPTGSQTITVTFGTAAASEHGAANSISYTNVSAFGTLVYNTDNTATALLPNMSSAVGQMVTCIMQGFTTTFTQLNGSVRYNQPEVSSQNLAVVMQDAAVASPSQALVDFTGTTNTTWGALGLPLLPPWQVNTTAPAYDATGSGNGDNSSTLSWTHTAATNAFVVVAVCVYGNFSINSVTYGGNVMFELSGGILDNAVGDGLLSLYVLNDPPTGSQTITATLSGSTYVSGNSVSYTGVGGATAASNVFGAGTPLSQFVSAPSNVMVVQAFGWQTSTAQAIPNGGTSRAVCAAFSSPNYLANLTINDSVGPTLFSAAPTAADNWDSTAIILMPTQPFTQSVYWDAAGVGGANHTTSAATVSTSFAHIAAGGSTCAVVVFVAVAMNAPFNSVTASYGGTPMNNEGGVIFYNVSGITYYIYQFGLIGVTSGSATVTVTATTTTAGSIAVTANSVSYMNVSSFGAYGINGTIGTSLGLSLNAAQGQMLVNAFSNDQDTAPYNLSGYNQNQRSSQAPGLSGISAPLLIGDAAGSGPSTTIGNLISFDATMGTSANWGAIGLQLLPIA